jgi:small subunit ribosomal protein S17
MQATVLRVCDPQTVKVEVESKIQHPIYKKFVRTTKSYLCGITAGVTVAVGDIVTIRESRPLSKTKRFLVMSKGQE